MHTGASVDTAALNTVLGWKLSSHPASGAGLPGVGGLPDVAEFRTPSACHPCSNVSRVPGGAELVPSLAFLMPGGRHRRATLHRQRC